MIGCQRYLHDIRDANRTVVCELSGFRASNPKNPSLRRVDDWPALTNSEYTDI